MGSARPLEEEEKSWLQQHSFEGATECEAMVFLWEALTPEAIKQRLDGKIIVVNSSRIGSSYNENEGHRPTTEINIEDWLAYFEGTSIFAVLEKPFIRMADQLRETVLTNKRKASAKAINERYKQYRFTFSFPEITPSTTYAVILDEVARNVFRMTGLIRWLESNSPHPIYCREEQ